MYRVRSSWDNPDSQLGAYDILQNAIKKADGYYGFCVFDEAGNNVHTSINKMRVPYRVRKTWADENSQVGAYDFYENAVIKANTVGNISVFDEKGNCVYTAKVTVKTMSYKAKLLRKVGNHAKGSTVIVTRDLKKQWVMEDGTVVKEKSYMDLLTQIYDSNCKYSKETAEAFVNGNGFSSSTGWLFWCSKWCQKVYIFKGSKGKWVLYKTAKCGTGNITYGDGSDQGVGFKWKIWDKEKVFDGPRGKQYWNMHYTSKWGNSIHKGSTGKPVTHGCIAMGDSAVQWVFNNLPINTRVVVY
jgi:hypothetical protein